MPKETERLEKEQSETLSDREAGGYRLQAALVDQSSVLQDVVLDKLGMFR